MSVSIPGVREKHYKKCFDFPSSNPSIHNFVGALAFLLDMLAPAIKHPVQSLMQHRAN